MFNPARLTLARRRRKFTKKALALALKVDQKTIIRYEIGDVEPPEESLAALSEALQFPISFFFGADVDEPVADAVSFRSLSTIPARDRDAALAAGAFAFLLDDWVEERFNLPPADLLEFREYSDPEAAARMLREKWGLGERPIRNMVHLLEAKGVRVFSLVENVRSLDAFSMWRRDIPYICLNTTKSAERGRFDAAHELGHLVLHKHGGPQGGRLAEDEANKFASAFLMPEAEVKAKLPRVDTLHQIMEGKKYWKVSLAALNYRLHKLCITSDWHYKHFCIQIAEKYRTEEPYSIAREISVVWAKVFGSLRSEGINKHKIANDLALPVFEVENLVFGLTNMQSIDGRASDPAKSKAQLSVV